MSRPIIVCDGISKQYRLGKKQRSLWNGATHTLRDAFSGAVRSARDLVKGARPDRAPEEDRFWALRDVSFEIQPGEVIGIIGRNGAGKSTLLKILSRIVEPTAGTARLRGRVASLLEVGTGFHAELTGRENIYLNGAILGMKRAEIVRKFDEIVDFAEVEDFLDTPVKYYSSGMYVRLAFAVAAHLEPEILIVDEVLAVGDVAFQKKCLGKMHDVSTDLGRTIVFISHNMGILAQLCQRGIWLEKGSIKATGRIQEVINAYLKSGLVRGAARALFANDSSKPSQFVSAEVLHGDGDLGSTFSCDEPIVIRVGYEVRKPDAGLFLQMSLETLEGAVVLLSDSRDIDPSVGERLGVGVHTFEITIPPRLLAPKTYSMFLASHSRYHGQIEDVPRCCEITLHEVGIDHPGRAGFLGVLLPWEHRREHEPIRPAGAAASA
jgi:lipopolysaccharide transport system ATP-binding protein